MKELFGDKKDAHQEIEYDEFKNAVIQNLK